MHPEIFTIPSFEIFGLNTPVLTLHSFGLMAMLGFLVPTFFMRKEFERIKIDPDFANTVVVAAIIGGFIGARLYYIIEHWSDFLADPMPMIFSGAGLVWYGGLIGGFLGVTWTTLHYRMPYWRVADTVGMLLLLGQTFGRTGCLLAADGDYGPPSNLPWAMSFPNGVVSTLADRNYHLRSLYEHMHPGEIVPVDITVHPTPIYDILLLLTFFALIWPLRKRNFVPGTYFGLYLIAVGVGRFITEFWRTTPKVLFGWMSLAQIISIVLITTGIVLIWWRNRNTTATAPT